MFPWGINDFISINRGTKDAYKAKEMETSFKSLGTAGKSSKMFAELKRYVCKITQERTIQGEAQPWVWPLLSSLIFPQSHSGGSKNA